MRLHAVIQDILKIILKATIMHSLASVIMLLSYVSGKLHSEKLPMSPVWVTVSSLEDEDSPSDRKIQLHWDSTVRKVALFTQDPALGSKPVYWINQTGSEGGMQETDIALTPGSLPGGWERPSGGRVNDQAVPGEHCLHAWIAAYEEDRIKYVDCLKIRPTWMFDNRLALGSLDLASLMVPGTHNSGCYKKGYRSIVSRYILTQDQDIWTQLVHGIRYLDLRVGYYPVKKEGLEQHCDMSCFWLNHDLIKVRPLIGVLEEIKDFLMTSQDEVIILDFHRFPVGFTGRPGRHELLAELLHRELGDLALPHLDANLTLDTIWTQKRRLIITYGHNVTVEENGWLWPGLTQMWGNVQTSEELKNYIEACMTLDPPFDGLWATMAHLTPLPLDLLIRPKGGIRPLAHLVGPNLTTWASESWWSKANIVATDFFLETDIVSLAVATNLRKGYRQKHYVLL